jgi:hypothetical protein
MASPKKNYLDRSLFPDGYSPHQYSQYRKAMGLYGGRDDGSVKQAINTGRISTLPNGKIDPDIADKEWTNYKNPGSAQARNAEGEFLVDQDDYRKRKQIAETESAEYKARLDEIKVLEAEGKLLDAEAVTTEIFDAVRVLRNSILNIPSRVASLVAHEHSEKKIVQLLDKEFRICLEDLSKKIIDGK